MVPDTLVGEAGPSAVHRDALKEAIGAGQEVVPHTEYQEKPLEWITEKLGVRRETLVWSENEGYGEHEWDGDHDPFVQALEALADWENVGVESATGTGKTFTLACITFWFLAVFENAIVVTAAPKEDQLLDKVWKEIEDLWPRFERHFPEARLMDSGEIRMRAGTSRKWKAKAEVVGVSAGEKSATKAQGEHAEHMLIITEETPGIHPAIMTAFDNTRTAPHNLQVSVGNPDFEEDPLHEFCLEPDVRHIRVSAYDHPNIVTGDHSIVPGAVSLKDLRRREKKYENQPAFQKSRLRGISPEQAFGTALKFRSSDHLESLSRASIEHLIDAQEAPVVGGIDFGSWRFAFLAAVVGRARQVRVFEEYFSQREDTATRAEAIHELLASYGAPKRTRIWGDSANQQQIIDINREFRKLDSPYRVVGCERESKVRQASVERLNRMLGNGSLLFRREIGEGMTWRKGQNQASDGEPVEGSRLLWEIKNWRYPEPSEGEAQDQDPDDDTADGADMMAALRYMVMSHLQSAPKPARDESPDPNKDPTDLSERMEKIQKMQENAARGRWL